MKTIRMSLAVWSLGALLIAACSGGGGGGAKPPAPVNTMTLTTTNAAGASITFTATPANTIFSAYKTAGDARTIVSICSDVDQDNDCSILIVMTIDGTTAQTYSMSDPASVTQIVYHDDETETGVLSHYLSSDGAIVLTESGTAAGDAVKGTFTSTLTCNSGCAGNIVLSGTFDIALSQ